MVAQHHQAFGRRVGAQLLDCLPLIGLQQALTRVSSICWRIAESARKAAHPLLLLELSGSLDNRSNHSQRCWRFAIRSPLICYRSSYQGVPAALVASAVIGHPPTVKVGGCLAFHSTEGSTLGLSAEIGRFRQTAAVRGSQIHGILDPGGKVCGPLAFELVRQAFRRFAWLRRMTRQSARAQATDGSFHE